MAPQRLARESRSRITSDIGNAYGMLASVQVHQYTPEQLHGCLSLSSAVKDLVYGAYTHERECAHAALS